MRKKRSLTGKKRPGTFAKIRRDGTQGTPLRLMFQDEARFGFITDMRRAGAPKPMRPLCPGLLTHPYTYAYAAVDVLTGQRDALILPHLNTPCLQVFQDEVSARHPTNLIVMMLDGADWHRSYDRHVPDNIPL